MAAGNAYPTITVPAVANVGDGSTVTGSFAIGTDFGDGDLSNNTATVQQEFSNGSDMSIKKTAALAVVDDVTQVTYTLTPRLEGGINPTNVNVTDTLPAGVTYISHSAPAPWNCSFETATLGCTYNGTWNDGPFSNLPSIEIVARVDVGTEVSNTATVSLPSGQTDPNPGNNSSTTNVTNAADLSIQKRATISPVAHEQPYNWEIRVRNQGPLPVAAGQTITITERIPEGMSLTAAPSGNGWTCTSADSYPISGPHTFECSRSGPLAVNTNTSWISVPVKHTTDDSQLNNDACVELTGSGPQDNVSGNNCTSVGNTSTTKTADLQISKTADKTSVVVGEELLYTLTVTNNGPDAASNIHIRDTLNDLIQFGDGSWVKVTPSDASCTPLSGSGGTLDCDIGTLEKNQSKSIQITVLPANKMADPTTRKNTATVNSSDVGDPDRDNNTASANTTVEPRVDVTVSKTVQPTPTRVGEPTVYVVTVKNNGPSAAKNVRITDQLPTNAAFISLGNVGGSQGSCGTTPAADQIGGELKCNWTQLAAGEQHTVTYQLRPLSDALDGTIKNTVTVTSDGIDLGTSTKTATTETEVKKAELDVVVSKTDNPDPLNLGEIVTYTVDITNAGPSFGTDLVMTDTFAYEGGSTGANSAIFSYQGGLAATVAGVPVAAPDCDEPELGATSGKLVCRFDTIAPKNANKVQVTYQMRAESIIQAGAYSGTVANHVRVAIAEEELHDSNNEVEEDTTAARKDIATDLALAKAVDKAISAAGEELQYTLTVTNNGPLDSIGAQIIDNLPVGTTFISSADGCIDAGDDQVTCAVGDLRHGESKDFIFTVRIDDPYSGYTPIINRATLDAPGDTNPDNNDAEARTHIPGSEVDPQVAASIAGIVYHDRNDDGVHDLGVEEGIPGVVVELWQAGTKVDETTTDALGNYRFENLMPGTYTVKEVQPADWTDGKDNAVGTGASGAGSSGNDEFIDVVLGDGDNAVNYNFGELKAGDASLASICGKVYHDRNDDGAYTGGSEEGIAGVRIELWQLNGSPVKVGETTTGVDGNYCFVDLAPAKYEVREIQPAGWAQGKPNNPGTGATSAGSASGSDVFTGIQLGAGDAAVDYNFGEIKGADASLASICGKVYHDANDNGELNGGETGVKGATVELYQGGVLVASIITDADGNYCFDDLAAGVYTVREIHPDGWTPGKDNATGTGATQPGTSGDHAFRDVELAEGDKAVNYNFGVLRIAAIPLLSQWSLLLLMLLLIGVMWRHQRGQIRYS